MKPSKPLPGRKSIMVKLAVIFTVLIVISTSLIAGLNLWIIFSRFETDLKNTCLRSLKNAQGLILEHAGQAENIAELLAGSGEVRQNMDDGALQEFLDSRKDIWFSAIVEIYDIRMNLAARSFAPGNKTESFFTPPNGQLVRAALDLSRGSDFYITPGGPAIKAAEPIVEMSTLEPVGAVIVTLPFNIRFLRILKEWVQADIILADNRNAMFNAKTGLNEGWNTISTIQDETGAPSAHNIKKRSFDPSGASGAVPEKEIIGGTQFITAYTPLSNKRDQVVGFLGAAVNTRVIEQARKESLIIVLIALLAVCVIAGVTAALTAGSFTRPIRELASAIHAMARGDLDRKVHLKQQDEIGDLARDLNHMGSRLKLYIQRSVEARAASRAKSEFLANMSHEIRTPLNAVLGLTELLLKSGPSPKQENYLKKIHGSAFVLSGIINDILDFSGIEAGKMEIEESGFQLSAVLDNIQDMFEAGAAEKGMKLIAAPDGDIPDNLVGDPSRIQQVLMNLVSNALKFSNKGDVRIQVEKRPTVDSDSKNRITLLFSVHDNGVGIEPEKTNLLFQPFSQLDNSITRRYGGTGLGLHICKRLVELMGGSIWVESTPEAGSSFFFTVAVKPAGTGSAWEPKERPPDRIEQTLDGVKILLVEDNPINRLVALELLEKTGAIIEIAENGKEAVEAVRKNNFDAVLMDIQMPEMDGYTAVGIIRELTPGGDGLNFGRRFNRRNVPIIAMTAHGLSEDREKCLKAGMNDYISKPVDPHKLYQTIRKWVFRSKTGRPDSADNGVATHAPEKPPEKNVPLHVESALKRINGNKTLLKKLLHTFSSNYHDFPRRIKNALEQNDTARAAALCHEIKGVAANLSAVPLQNAAESLEKLLKSNPEHDDTPIRKQMKTFEIELETLLETTPKLLEQKLSDKTKSNPETAPENTAPPSDIADYLNQLEKYIAAHSPQAETYVEKIKARLTDPKLLEKCRQLESDLEVFNFRDARKHFREIADSVGSDGLGGALE